jgi:hypothetical protein
MFATEATPKVVQVAVARVTVCTVLLGSVYLIARIAVAVAVDEVQAIAATTRYKVVTGVT